MKNLISILIILNSFVYGQTNSLKINLKNGTSTIISIDDIQKIEFKNVTNMERVEEHLQIINSLKLEQNYPNPFNPSTTIIYQIPRSSNVNLRIYDLNGQLVKEVINELQTEGIYKVTWDGTNQNHEQVASGIYIYTIKYAGLLSSRKMIFIK